MEAGSRSMGGGEFVTCIAAVLSTVDRRIPTKMPGRSTPGWPGGGGGGG